MNILTMLLSIFCALLLNPAEALPLEGRTICLDPGHCISTAQKSELVSPFSDAVKPQYTRGTSGKSQSEVEVNLAVCLMLRDELEALGATVVMTREVNEITISGLERMEISNNCGADVVIHVHADGSNDPTVRGVSVLVPGGDLLGWPEIEAPSKALGQMMIDCIAAQTGAKNLAPSSGTICRDITGRKFRPCCWRWAFSRTRRRMLCWRRRRIGRRLWTGLWKRCYFGLKINKSDKREKMPGEYSPGIF